MNIDDLTPEQRAKVDSFKNPDDILEFAKSEGHELTDDELEQISAGGWFDAKSNELKCTSCGSTRFSPQGMHSFKCQDCGCLFTAK